ncbi:hypothetical protein DEFR109230_11755 [Deinococcus frigens]
MALLGLNLAKVDILANLWKFDDIGGSEGHNMVTPSAYAEIAQTFVLARV